MIGENGEKGEGVPVSQAAAAPERCPLSMIPPSRYTFDT
jgi:hypothetical protein